MKRLKSWLRRRWRARVADEFASLPFSEDEFARLVRSRSSSDKKILANGLALRGPVMRRSAKIPG